MTYVIDTVIVIVLTEVLAFWYKEMEWEEVAMVIALVLSLACVRIIAVRFPPGRCGKSCNEKTSKKQRLDRHVFVGPAILHRKVDNFRVVNGKDTRGGRLIHIFCG